MNASIRLAENRDIETILRFMKAYYELEGIIFDRERSFNTIEDVMTSPYGKLFIIENNNRSVGYFCIAFSYTLENHGRDCFLDEIFIEAGSRRKGIGTEVMSHIENYLRKNGFKAMHLIVNNQNDAGLNYYLKNGFTIPDFRFMSKRLIL